MGPTPEENASAKELLFFSGLLLKGSGEAPALSFCVERMSNTDVASSPHCSLSQSAQCHGHSSFMTAATRSRPLPDGMLRTNCLPFSLFTDAAMVLYE